MFNTGLLVVEVQKRSCLWNTKDSSHSDRQAKLRAWEQIAKSLNTSSDSYSLNNKNITIDVLQRKWKHLRDYYIREKKRTSKANSSAESSCLDRDSSGARKRKSPLLDMLQFLDVNRETEIEEVTVERNVAEENFYPETNEEEDKSNSEYELVISRPCKVQRIEAHQSYLNVLGEDNEDSADKQFLKSLLPIIKNMSTKERFKFRAQLLNPKPPQEYSVSCIDEEDDSRTPEPRKRHRVARKSEEKEVINKDTNKETSAEATPKRDEFAIYGEYVANKLRNIRNTHARHTAEYHINGVLYKAEMGEYDIVSRDTNQTRSANSRESTNAGTISSMMFEEDDSNDIIKTEVLE